MSVGGFCIPFLIFISFLIQIARPKKPSSIFELVLKSAKCSQDIAIQAKNVQILQSIIGDSPIESEIMLDLMCANSSNKSCCDILKLLETILSIPYSISKKLILAIFIIKNRGLVLSALLIVNFLRQETFLAHKFSGELINYRISYLSLRGITTILDYICVISQDSLHLLSCDSPIIHDLTLFREMNEKFYRQPKLGKFVESLFPDEEKEKLKRSENILTPPKLSCPECKHRWNNYISKIYKKPIVNFDRPFGKVFISFIRETTLMIEKGDVTAWNLLQCAYLSDFFLVLTSLEKEYKSYNHLASIIYQDFSYFVLSIRANNDKLMSFK